MMTMNPASPLSSHVSAGGCLVATDGRVLPLVSAELVADAKAGVARVVLKQRFGNPHDVPLTVTYSFPLPADAAVSGYAFTMGARRIVGEIDKRAAARERCEQAIVEGKTAGLVEQDRTSLFTQEIGNIPPRTEVVAEITIDQRLVWIETEGGWEWRFPTAAAPRYLGAAGRVDDAARVTQDVADGALGARLGLSLRVRDALTRAVESPSHGIRANGGDVTLADGAGVRLDRDVVVRWGVAASTVGLGIDVGAGPVEGRTFALLSIVPPMPEARAAAVARDLIVLLDTSGSMAGEPLDQARRVVSAVIGTLGERDRLEMIEFSSAPRSWKKGPESATAAAKRDALAWLGNLRASGGTEMREGILAALATLRAESQRQVVLVTDGLIGFEHEVVAAIRERLPSGSRVHTVGVGSAVNRSLTGPVARAGRGVEVVIGLGEDPERAARRILARTNAPLVVDVVVEGSAIVACAPSRVPDLFAGAPVVVGLELREGGGDITVRGRTSAGAWSATARVPSAREGGLAAAKLFAREVVEDLEMRVASGEPREALDRTIEQTGIDFQIATRLTSWIAVSEETTVDPADPVRRVRMPQELPHGMSVDALGLRAAMPGMPMALARRVMFAAAPMAPAAAPPPQAAGFGGGAPKPGGAGFMGKMRAMFSPPSESRAKQHESTRAGGVAAERRVPGKIKLRKGAQLVITIDLDAELAWQVVGDVELTWSDGSTSRAAVEHGTRMGDYAAGDTIRLVLKLEAGDAARTDDPVRVAIAELSLVIEL
jgi:Ca-activated chloride channel family protein